jgi:hypothetical protein
MRKFIAAVVLAASTLVSTPASAFTLTDPSTWFNSCYWQWELQGYELIVISHDPSGQPNGWAYLPRYGWRCVPY